MKGLNSLLILLIFSHSISAVDILIDEKLKSNIIYELVTNDIIIKSNKYSSINIIYPVKAEYSNISNNNKLKLSNIEYTSEIVNLHGNYNLSKKLNYKSGTYYISWDNKISSLQDSRPLNEYLNTIQIVLRPDDTFHGYLMELINTPFIYTPLRNSNGLNQVDNRIGSDCSTFVTYGLRRMGKKIKYTNPFTFVNELKSLSKSYFTISTDYYERNIYVDTNNKTFSLNQELIDHGIIISFQTQISVLYEDKGIKGILDSEDILLQSWKDGPYFTTFKDSGFYDFPIKVYTY